MGVPVPASLADIRERKETMTRRKEGMEGTSKNLNHEVTEPSLEEGA